MNYNVNDLAVGDEAIVNVSPGEWQLGNVVCVTPTQVHVEIERPKGCIMKFRRLNGRQVSADDWHPAYVYLRGDEGIEKRLRDTQHSRWRDSTIRQIQADIADASDDTLCQVAEIIKQGKEVTNG